MTQQISPKQTASWKIFWCPSLAKVGKRYNKGLYHRSSLPGCSCEGLKIFPIKWRLLWMRHGRTGCGQGVQRQITDHLSNRWY